MQEVIKKQLTADEALSLRGTFYAKRWQSNGFYPVYKFEYNNENGTYTMLLRKGERWVSLSSGDYEWFKNIFEHNAFILTTHCMVNNKHYENEI